MNMSKKKKKFCDYYIESGNATQSAIRAGYSERTARSQGQRLLTCVDIKQYIEQRQKQTETKRTASMIEVKEFWASVLFSKEESTYNKIKVSELIAKTNGAFTENLNIKDSSKATSLLESINNQLKR